MTHKDIRPTPAEIKEARMLSQLTQKQAAFVCRVDLRTWTRWEAGHTVMPAGLWELFTLRAGAPVTKD